MILIVNNCDPPVTYLKARTGEVLASRIQTIRDCYKFGAAEFTAVVFVGELPDQDAINYLRSRIRSAQPI